MGRALSLLLRALTASWGSHLHDLPTAPPPNTTTPGVRFQYTNLGRTWSVPGRGSVFIFPLPESRCWRGVVQGRVGALGSGGERDGEEGGQREEVGGLRQGSPPQGDCLQVGLPRGSGWALLQTTSCKLPFTISLSSERGPKARGVMGAAPKPRGSQQQHRGPLALTGFSRGISSVGQASRPRRCLWGSPPPSLGVPSLWPTRSQTWWKWVSMSRFWANNESRDASNACSVLPGRGPESRTLSSTEDD